MLDDERVRRAIADEQRLAAVAGAERALPELREGFARLARLAASLTGAATGAITLVDQDRLLVTTGEERATPTEVLSTGERLTCAHAVAGEQALVVPDCRHDARFRANPLAQQGVLRSYAGVPLWDGAGHVLGSVCVYDPAPGLVVTPATLGALADLAATAGTLLAQHREGRLQRAQREVLEAIGAARPLPEVLEVLAGRVEALLGPRLLVSVLLTSEDGRRLHDAAGPSLPPAWRRAVDGMAVGEGVGACGTAVHRREPVTVADLATDPACTHLASLAVEHGLLSCTSLPVLDHDGQVLGTFALYQRSRSDQRSPSGPQRGGRTVLASEGSTAVVTAFRDLVRVAIERERSRRHRDRARRELLRLATRDGVTGLLNRTAFLAAAAEALVDEPAHGHVHALLTCDVDDFKVVNDSLGHQAGDAYLSAVAEQLHAGLRPDDVVARFAGDGFTILLTDLPPDTVHVVAQRVLACFAAPFPVPTSAPGSGQTLPRCSARGAAGVVELTASIGVSTTALSASRDLDVLLRDSDLALRGAKRGGRARVQVCDAGLQARAATHLDLDLALRGAVARGELTLHYQPEVDTGTGELSGFEALLRWTRPGRGAVSPADFIPVAETSGLIVEIGRFVLESACRQLADWRALHPAARALTVWVNVSAHQLAGAAFVETVTGALAGAGLPGAALGLEITETAVMADPAQAAAVLSRLREVGVRIAVDDFGTGYSSLSVLKTLPVDVVKIDRAFVRGLGVDDDDARLVSAIVSMAHALDLSVVAEGVEEVDQDAVLRALGCDTLQGYLVGRPQPPDEASALLRTQPQRSG